MKTHNTKYATLKMSHTQTLTDIETPVSVAVYGAVAPHLHSALRQNVVNRHWGKI